MIGARHPVRRRIVATIVALGLGSAIVVTLSLLAQREGIEAAESALTRAAPWLLLWRLGVFGVLMLYWHELVDRLAKSARLTVATTAVLQRWRARAGAGLVVMDLVLVEDVFGLLRRTVL